MSTKKTYQLSDVNSVKKAIRITVKTRSRVIIFESKHRNGLLTYSTSDAEEQTAIESADFFKEGKVKLTGSVDIPDSEAKAEAKKNAALEEELDNLKKELAEQKAANAKLENTNPKDIGEGGENPGNNNEGPTEHPEVVTFQQAKDLLTGTYKVSYNNNSLKNPKGIFEKAAELGISFPNLKPTEE